MPEVTRPAEYPSQHESVAVLRDGRSVLVRPICPDDADALVAFHGRLSRETVYYRYFSPIPVLKEPWLSRLVNVDYRDRMALVAVLSDDIIGVGRYDRLAATDHAEVAFTVEDAFQGHGVGTLLLERLVPVARANGIRAFEAEVLADNRRMLGVFADVGFTPHKDMDAGSVHVGFAIDPSETFVRAMETREASAVTSSLVPLFRPNAVAVVGAGRQAGTIGHEILRNLVTHGFDGPVYPVNPNASHVASVRAYPSLAELPEPADMAVIVVPAPLVRGVVEQAATAGVKVVVIVTAGFAETSDEGADTQRELTRFVRSHGMRMVGPNCMGVLNTDPRVCLDATFAPSWPPAGGMAISSQSGGLGLAILEQASRLGLGVSSFVSVGNKADVSGNDLLQYWEQDTETSMIVLYLESFGNPRKFARIARRVSARKPILAVKAGRSESGRRAASSHTAALASSEAAVDALFAQAGVIRTNTLPELFDVASLLSHQPVPAGRRVGILTNAGGPGILAADACEGAGLEVSPLDPATVAELRTFLVREASVGNPVDMIAAATADDYRRAIELLLADEWIDALIVIFLPPLVTRTDEVAAAILAGTAQTAKPVLACFPSPEGGNGVLTGEHHLVPTYAFPEPAARALGLAARYGAWRRQPAGVVPDLEIDRERATALVENSPAGWLGVTDGQELLSCYGISTAQSTTATTAAEAVIAAEAIGFPVAVKIDLPVVVHKTDVGGVVLNLRTPAEVEQAVAHLGTELAAERVVVQSMVGDGIEVLIGMTSDPVFGPLIGFGAGGVQAEVLRDVAFRITPLSDQDAAEMVRSIRSYPLLEGFRGRPPGDVVAVEETLLRLSALVEDFPQVAEVDLNPVLVHPPGQGVTVVDAKVRVGDQPR